jgi:hypothetical protein
VLAPKVVGEGKVVSTNQKKCSLYSFGFVHFSVQQVLARTMTSPFQLDPLFFASPSTLLKPFPSFALLSLEYFSTSS